MKKTVIGGVYYGLHNIGDEAILFSMINSFFMLSELSVLSYGSKWINERFPDVKIRQITADYGKPKLGLYVVPKKNLLINIKKVKDEIKFYKKNDIYICGGATILSDCPWYSLKTVELAGKAGIPVYLWGVGMAEIEDSDAFDYIKKVLNQSYVKKVFTRDEYVKDRIQNLGVMSEKLFVSYDPAIMIDGDSFNNKKYLNDYQEVDYYDNHMNIVVTISGEADVVKKTPIDVLCNAISQLQIKYSANIFMIPTGCGEHCMDTALMKKLKKEIANEHIHLIEREFFPSDLVAFLKNIDVIISSRLHMNILGVCAGTPSIGLVRNMKNIDFANLIDLPYLELSTLTVNELLSAMEDVFSKLEFYRKNISMKKKNMRATYISAVKMMEKEFLSKYK